MSTYVVVGASRGIGYALLRKFSSDPANTVFGIVRTPAPTEEQVRKDGLNATIVQGDMTNYKSLLSAAEKVSKPVDYLWVNGGHLHDDTAGKFFTDYNVENYAKMTDDLRKGFETNVLGVINTINAFLPLVQKSEIKKVITLTTGLADDNLTRDYGIWETAAYSVGKAATNTVIAKYDAKFRSEGILFLGISPGVVDVGKPASETGQNLGAKFYKYSKAVKMLKPEESVEAMLKVVDESRAEGDGGQFYSHLGRHQRWL